MDLAAWGFQGLHLLEGEEVVLGLGQHRGLITSAVRDRALLLLTNRRAFYLAQQGRRWQAVVAGLEEVEALEMGSAGKNPMTLAIAAVGLVAGVLGWLFLAPSPAILPWVAAVLAGAGAVLLVLFFAFPEEGALVLRVGTGQVRLEVSSQESASQISTLVNQLFTLKEALRRTPSPAPQQLAETPLSHATPPEPPPVEEMGPREPHPVSSNASGGDPLQASVVPPTVPQPEERPPDW